MTRPPARPEAASLVDRERRVLRRTVTGIWIGLPALAVGSAAVAVGSAVALLAAPGLRLFAVALGVVLVGPPLGALFAVASAIALDGDPTIRLWARNLYRRWRFGLLAVLPLGVVASAFLAGWQIRAESGGGQVWVLPSLALAGAGTVLLAPTTLAVLAIGAAHEGSWRTRWTLAAICTWRFPVRGLAAPAVVVAGLWAATHSSASVLPLVPAPVALVAAAAVWTTMPRLGYDRELPVPSTAPREPSPTQ